MRTWKRAHGRLPCGAAADCWIHDGDPYLELGRDRWTARRCASHADEAVPAMVEGHEAPAPRFTSTRQLARSVERHDVKMAQAGKDD